MFAIREKDVRTVYYGHAPKSVEITRDLLSGFDYTYNEMYFILFYIGHYDDFISWEPPQKQYNHRNRYLIKITYVNGIISELFLYLSLQIIVIYGRIQGAP